jgi:3-deoxy-D-manno-octulosonate 8-phosphate phosphatase (KDO 8-P phosphatase)
MNIKDGYAVQHCIKMGFPIAIISGGSSDEVRKRFEYLGVTDIYMHSASKMKDYEAFKNKYGFQDEEILYMGDDLPDFEIMKKAGISACPADAAHEIKEISQYISEKGGGQGCARDVIEQVLRIHDKWLVDESFIW